MSALLVACDLCVPLDLPLYPGSPDIGVAFHLLGLSYLTEPWLLLGCLSHHKQSNQVSRRAIQTPQALNRLLAPAKRHTLSECSSIIVIFTFI